MFLSRRKSHHNSKDVREKVTALRARQMGGDGRRWAEMGGLTDRQTDRQTNRQTERQAIRQ